MVAAVLAILAICVCGAVGVAFWSWQTPDRPSDVHVGPPPEVVRSPAPELRPLEAVPHPAPKPPRPVLAPRPRPKSQLPEEDALQKPEPWGVKPEVKSQDGKRTLFTLKPFAEDKAIMPADTRVNFETIDRERKSSAAVTLLQFYRDFLCVRRARRAMICEFHLLFDSCFHLSNGEYISITEWLDRTVTGRELPDAVEGARRLGAAGTPLSEERTSFLE